MTVRVYSGMGCRCRYDAQDIYGDHAFSCARGRGERGKWHGGLRDFWMMLGSTAGASISKEVSGFLPNSNMSADLDIRDSLTSPTTLLTFELVTPRNTTRPRISAERAQLSQEPVPSMRLPGKTKSGGLPANRWASASSACATSPADA